MSLGMGRRARVRARARSSKRGEGLARRSFDCGAAGRGRDDEPLMRPQFFAGGVRSSHENRRVTNRRFAAVTKLSERPTRLLARSKSHDDATRAATNRCQRRMPRPRCVTVVVSVAVFALFVIVIAAAASRCCSSPTDTPTAGEDNNATRRAAEKKKKPPHPFFPG